jgi:hypothetical protein
VPARQQASSTTTAADLKPSPRVQHITLSHKPYASSPAVPVNFTVYPAAAVPAAAQAAPPL